MQYSERNGIPLRSVHFDLTYRPYKLGAKNNFTIYIRVVVRLCSTSLPAVIQHDLNKLLEHDFNPRDFEAAPQCLLKYMGMKQLLKMEYHGWIDFSVTAMELATIFPREQNFAMHENKKLVSSNLLYILITCCYV